jgi:hypothetical protein
MGVAFFADYGGDGFTCIFVTNVTHFPITQTWQSWNSVFQAFSVSAT